MQTTTCMIGEAYGLFMKRKQDGEERSDPPGEAVSASPSYNHRKLSRSAAPRADEQRPAAKAIPYSYPYIGPPRHPRYRRPNMHRVLFDHLDLRLPSASPMVPQALKLAKERIKPR